jgi:hypothetical protein
MTTQAEHSETWLVKLVDGKQYRIDRATFDAIQAAAAGDDNGTGWLVEFNTLDSEAKRTNAILLVNVQHIVTIRPYSVTPFTVTSVSTRR